MKSDEPVAPFPVPPWTDMQTEGWLTEYPLPADFRWADRYGDERPVLPSYRIKGGYGKWLHETPYFPGLFEQIHFILARAAADQVLTVDWLVEELNKRRAHGEQTALL